MKKLLIILLLAAVFFPGCKKPTEGLTLNISPDVIKYIAVIDLKDLATDDPVSGSLNVSFSGQDGDYIYNTKGTKKFEVKNGKLVIGLGPQREPSGSDTVKFTMNISGDDYLPLSVEGIFTEGQLVHHMREQLLNINHPPEGITIKKETYTLSNGRITGTGILQAKPAGDSVYYDDGLSTVVLPEGTSFYYYKRIQNGTAEGTRMVPVWKDVTHPESHNGVVNNVTDRIFDGYEEEKYTYPVYTYVKETFTGNEVTVYAIYYNDTNSVGYRTVPDADKIFYPANPVHLYDGTTAQNQAELLFRSAAAKRLYDVQFVAKVGSNSINVSPDQASEWFTSLVIPPSTINPRTGQPVVAGDSIEVGVDLENGITKRAVIYEVNGQLRVENQYGMVGYYYVAPYQADYDVDVDGTYSDDDFPDRENLRTFISIPNVGGFSIYSGGSVSYSGTIYASTPIPTDASFTTYYWGSLKSGQLSGLSGSISPFQPPFSRQLEGLSEWNFNLNCGSRKTYTPTYFASSVQYTGPQNGSFDANVQDGHWKTRGLRLNAEYHFSGKGFSNTVGGSVSSERTYTIYPVNDITDEGTGLCHELGLD